MALVLLRSRCDAEGWVGWFFAMVPTLYKPVQAVPCIHYPLLHKSRFVWKGFIPFVELKSRF